MKLRRYLKTILPSGARIKVGSIDGTGIWYAGTREELMEHMIEYSDKALEVFKKRREICLSRIEDIAKLKKAGTYAEFLRDAIEQMRYGGAPSYSYEDYVKHLTLAGKSIAIQQKSLQKLQSIIDSFVSFDERQVREVQKSISEEGYTTLYIDGYEMGVFWMAEEAEQRGVCLGIGGAPDE